MAFVGRDHELEALLAESVRWTGRIALISGEAGIGKTRIADELSQRAEKNGWSVTWGRAWEGEGTPAFWPWLQVLRTLASTRALENAWNESCAAWPALVTLAPGRVAEPSDPVQARFRLFEAVANALRRIGEDTPLLVVLDDLHAADLSTLTLLRFVARDLRGARVFVVATVRDVSFLASEQTSNLLAEVSREAIHVPLARLGAADIERWVALAASRLSSKLDKVLALSEGNPLFVEELLAASSKRPDAAWTTAAMPLGIRELIRSHLALPSAQAQAFLEIAAVVGRDFTMAVCMDVAKCSEPDARAWIREAVAAGIVTPVEADGCFRFAHVLLRDEMYARIGERRGEVHRALARAFDDEAPSVAVEHWLAGARPEDIARATRAVRAAVHEAHQRLAFEDAARLGERALAVFEMPPTDQATLRMAVGEARMHAGETTLGQRAFARAAEIAEAIADPELFARATLAGACEQSMNRDDATIEALRRALRGLPEVDSSLRAHLMARLCSALLPARPDEAEEFRRLADDSVAMARRVGDEATLFAVLTLVADGFSATVEAEERVSALSESVSLGVRLGRSARVLSLLGRLIAGRYELGDPDGAERDLVMAERLIARHPQPHYAWRAPLLRAVTCALQGRFEEGAALQREALRIATENDLPTARMFVCVHRMCFQYIRGDSDGYDEFAHLVTQTMTSLPLYDVFSAIPHAMNGEVERVRTSIEKLRGLPLDIVPGVTVLGWPCVEAQLTEHAEFFYDLVCAQSKHVTIEFGPGGFATPGPTELLAGRLALLLGRERAALAHFETALAFARRIRSPPYIAQCELGCAQALAVRSPSDARMHGEHARTIARDLGMRVIRESAETLLASLPDAPPTKASARSERPTVELARCAEIWSLTLCPKKLMLKDTKGMAYLASLIAEPYREIHVLELARIDDGGDAGPMLDERAKRAYRERAESLRAELEVATRDNDLARTVKMREELEALGDELARAVGLGGRHRRAVSAAERARVNVQRRLKDVIRRIRDDDADLGEHLDRSVRTGLFCVYSPVWL